LNPRCWGNILSEQTAEMTCSTLPTHGYDKYTRMIADVLLPDGTNVNHTLVKDGWCWWYRKYAPGDTMLEGLERGARESREGVWADPQPVLPWVYRKVRRGSGSSILSGLFGFA